MRVWDLPPNFLCRRHLLAQHNEIHTIWSVITTDKRGWARHPETERWRGKLPALLTRHDHTAAEMTARGYKHASSLPSIEQGDTEQDVLVDSLVRQRELLRAKPCECDPPASRSQ